jgi:hypothetical protein
VTSRYYPSLDRLQKLELLLESAEGTHLEAKIRVELERENERRAREAEEKSPQRRPLQAGGR